ncbi:hypothetical protein [Brevundimonas sp.]|uniref:hypothetical protein n=1 Tax=Brevundimonas sp. TaxID=1871086 RepID=UPI00272F8CAB|nr:hypothetical protein [Brevundimonas sp.]
MAGYSRVMEIIRHDDGSLTIPVAALPEVTDDDGVVTPAVGETSMTIRPGEGGYIDALAEWDAQQNPDRGEAVSTASGRDEAMAVVHAVAEDPTHVAEAVDSLDDPAAGAEALRHVLVGGTPSVKAFAHEVAEAEGGDELAPHQATKIIGQVLAEVDARPE